MYGLVAVLTGGADAAQLIMYLYSVATIFVFIWGMRKIAEVRAHSLSIHPS